ncbi:MAG: SMC-Scp complex subunit ScpB [Parcubacteria group bacterium]
MTNLDSHIEALLFLKGDPMTIRELAKILSAKENEIKDAISVLDEKLSDRGIRLIRKDDSVALATSLESSEVCKNLTKEEFNPELSKASLEVVSIIIYKSPITRAEIDYIRGVNSTFTIRNLLIRGLIERIPNPRDSRGYLYRPAFQFFQYLGIKNIEELPEYGAFNKKIENFINEKESDNNNDI